MLEHMKNDKIQSVTGMILMGIWAGFANWQYPLPTVIQASITQGLLTALITFIMHHIIKKTVYKFKIWPLGALSGMLTSLSFLTIGHYLSATPEFLATISVPFLLASTFASILAYSFRKDI